MLQLSQALMNRPVMSLRTGGQVATAVKPLINPDNLKIEGWYCEDRLSKDMLILQSQDIRDILPQGLVINDHEVLSDPNELVRLKRTLEIAFEPLGKRVVTVTKKKMGKVDDYAVEMTTFYIKKLYASQSLIKSFRNSAFIIDRNQIVEITSAKIVIQDPQQPLKAKNSGMQAIEALPAA